MVIPDTGAGGNRDFVVSLRTVLLAKIGLGVAVILLIAGMVGIGFSVSLTQRVDQLQTFNDQLRRERRQIGQLREQLAEIWVVNERLRGMLGAPPLLQTQQAVQQSTPWGEPLSRFVGPGYRVRPDENPEMGVYLETTQGALVMATAEGRVLDITWSPKQGDMLILDHGEGLQTRYGKNVVILVQPGDYVFQGQTVGIIEGTVPDEQPVLFYQTTINGQSVDPLESLVSLSGAELPAQSEITTSR